jgi:hypothetical protein
MNSPKNAKSVVVTGDITVDWNIARVKRSESIIQGLNPDDLTTACCHYGGAAMLAELISALAKIVGNIEVYQPDLKDDIITPNDSRFSHSYAMWAPYKIDGRSKDRVWRVQEFLGLNPAKLEGLSKNKQVPLNKDPESPDLIVLIDANLGFRDHQECWPKGLANNQSWILVNTTKAVAQGPLWNHIQGNNCKRLIAILNATDLRGEQVQISSRLSWERTAQDIAWELIYNPTVIQLTKCACVIVSFGPAGAILFLNNAAEPSIVLFFDTNAMEGQWGRQYEGSMIGYNSCLVSAVAREILLNNEKPDIKRGIQTGIRAMRVLHVSGYGVYNNCLNNHETLQLAFPAEKIAAELTKDENVVSTVELKPSSLAVRLQNSANPRQMNPFWTILEDKYTGSLEQLAKNIVRQGSESALPEIPIGRFGDLTTVDRREIEALQSVSSLIREYLGRYQKTPLSIAVFGPPGSGKSFSIKQVAKSVAPGEIESITFNLSQFGGIEGLYDALHQVRDKALTGKIPIVFWDEFDTTLDQQKMGWLRYFLAPMQDGEFQEGQIVHPIGRSIFVFAGGTYTSMDTFGNDLGERQRIDVKMPDFVSRLKGFLDILGPNPYKFESNHRNINDPYYIIRRAILLRSVIERSASRLLRNDGSQKTVSIDEGVLRAFLLVRKYEHGARSIESIFSMSQLSGKTCFERSCLPSESQLNLHVNGREFTALMNQMELSDSIIEKMAKAFHNRYCEYLRSVKQYSWGPETSEEKKTHSSLVEYDKLPENEKEQNRNNVKDIPRKMDKVGYMMATNRSNEPIVEFQKEEVEYLARLEHERWMAQKLSEGWHYGKLSDKANKIHEDLLEWEKLPDDVKENDRVMIRAIPQIIATAGYIMFKLN